MNDGGAGDAWVCNPFESANVWEDPQFCDWEGEDFGLVDGSPCSEEHSPPQCGQIGAYATGCTGSPAQAVTWGGLKILYR